MSEEQQVRLNVHTEKMGTSYANAFQVRYSQDDVLALIQSLREYEARFGEIAVEEKAPEEE